MAEIILPGTYITVRDEGLISAGRVASGNIGIVGTAAKGPIGEVKILGSFTEARAMFGESGPWTAGAGQTPLTLVRALELVYNNGGRTVYAVRVADSAAAVASYQIKDDKDKSLITLQAHTPGAWGNDIRITISDDEAGQKQLVLTHGPVKETYPITTNSQFLQQVKQTSALVTATEDTVKDSAKIQNTVDQNNNVVAAAFSGGLNGEAAGPDDYKAGLAKLENEIVNIVLLAGQSDSDPGMSTALMGHLNATAEIKRERIGLIGSNGTDDLSAITGHSLNSDRLIFTAPGVKTTTVDPQTRAISQANLPGSYLAAAVAGLLSSVPVQTSPTNKVLAIEGLSTVFSSSQLEKLVQNRVLAVEKREGYRIVKGITTATNSAWHQITTRRIVDYAIYGVRSACNPYIGKLNNERVRGAMKATLDAFLTRMVDSEALVGYQLEVSATRPQEIAGEVAVKMTLQPTFSIDFILVTMYLG